MPLLKSKGLPFVTIGSLNDDEIVQIDHDNEGACRDLTAILLSRQWRRIAYMGNSKELLVDEARYRGYLKAHRDIGIEVDESLVFRKETSESMLRGHVDELLEKRWTVSSVRTMRCAILSSTSCGLRARVSRKTCVWRPVITVKCWTIILSLSPRCGSTTRR